MAEATEITSAYVQAPVKQPPAGVSGSIDRNLILHDAAVSTNSQSTEVSVEGGSFAELYVRCGTITDADETLIVVLEVDVNNDNAFKDLIRLPQFTDATMDNDDMARVVFIPRDTSTTGKGRVGVRLDFTVAGTTPSFPITAVLRPLGYGENPALGKLTT